jgi:hypothetical protein
MEIKPAGSEIWSKRGSSQVSRAILVREIQLAHFFSACYRKRNCPISRRIFGGFSGLLRGSARILCQVSALRYTAEPAVAHEEQKKEVR